MIVFPVLIPVQNFLFPGTGRENLKCHGKGRDGKFEACIPGNHGKREFRLTPAVSSFVFRSACQTKPYCHLFPGQYGKQPIRTGDARGERAAEGRGETKQKLLIIFDVAECGFVPLNCICCACLFVA